MYILGVLFDQVVCEFIRDNRDKFSRNPCKSPVAIKSRSPTAEDSETTGNELDGHIKFVLN